MHGYLLNHVVMFCPSALCQGRHGEIPDSSLQSTGSSRSSHSRSPSLHHMHEEDRPVPRRSHSHGYPHGHGPRGRLRFVTISSARFHLLFLVILNKYQQMNTANLFSPHPCQSSHIFTLTANLWLDFWLCTYLDF